MSTRDKATIDTRINLLDDQLEILIRREDEFQRVINDLQRMKDEVSVERASVERERKNLLEQKEPINWLPPELLAQVFEDLADMETDERDPLYRPSVIVSHVCRKWRTIALTTSQLWRNLFLSGFKTSTATEIYLERSGNVLLSIKYSTLSESPPHLEAFEITQLMDTLTPHLNRIKILSMQFKTALATTRIFPIMQNHLQTLPNLQRLTLGILNKDPSFTDTLSLLAVRPDTWRKTSLDIPQGSASSLVYLRVEKIPVFNFPVTLITNLRSLELAYPVRETRNRYYLRLSSLCLFVRETPLLEELILNNTVPFFDVYPGNEDRHLVAADSWSVQEMSTVKLKHLRILEWAFPARNEVYFFLSMFDTPVLEKLDLWVGDRPPSRNDLNFPLGYSEEFSSRQSTRGTISYPTLKDLSFQSDGRETSMATLREYILPSLEKVAFTNFDAAARKSDDDLPCLPIFPRLESIFRDPRLPLLTHLTLSHFKISPEAGRIEAMLGYMPLLTSLSLDSCTGVGRLMEALQVVTRRETVRTGILRSPRLEALSCWECQDLDFASLREVVRSRNRGIDNLSSAENLAEERTRKDTVGLKRTFVTTTQGSRIGNEDNSNKREFLGRKIRPLKGLPRHAYNQVASASLQGVSASPKNPTLTQGDVQPMHIIYLRLANCRLIHEQEALSLKDLGVVDVIWAGSDS